MKQFLKKAPFPLLLSLLLLANGCQNTIAITGESGESEETSKMCIRDRERAFWAIFLPFPCFLGD